jgi:hypothetical protein
MTEGGAVEAERRDTDGGPNGYYWKPRAEEAEAKVGRLREALAQVPCSMGTFNDAGEWERCVDWIARLKREDAGDGLPHPWCAALREQPTDTAEGGERP